MDGTLTAATTVGPAPTAYREGEVSITTCSVLVAIRHPVMRRYTRELLERQCRCWLVTEVADDELLADVLNRRRPDVLLVDTGDFPACCRTALDAWPPERTIVIGPEPEAAYRAAAVRLGAGAWLPRDRLVDDLDAALHRLVGLSHASRRVPRTLVDAGGAPALEGRGVAQCSRSGWGKPSASR